MATQNADPKSTDKGFGLLEELSANNTREWYKSHKEEFEQKPLGPFAAILSAISLRLHASDMAFDGGKKTMFRMHRDVRFLKDKSPYKTNVSGLLTPSGTKREKDGFVYLQLDANSGFGACGCYALDAKALGPIRDRIVRRKSASPTFLPGSAKRGSI